MSTYKILWANYHERSAGLKEALVQKSASPCAFEVEPVSLVKEYLSKLELAAYGLILASHPFDSEFRFQKNRMGRPHSGIHAVVSGARGSPANKKSPIVVLTSAEPKEYDALADLVFPTGIRDVLHTAEFEDNERGFRREIEKIVVRYAQLRGAATLNP